MNIEDYNIEDYNRQNCVSETSFIPYFFQMTLDAQKGKEDILAPLGNAFLTKSLEWTLQNSNCIFIR